MSLTEYKKKRSFKKTPEPSGAKKASSSSGLHFVVQKHAASRLHYDFRLEMEGVLKSWAVPKGPSMNPGDKRLAMMVEDHPYNYRSFEGIIPEGNYGAGTVIVWDEGTYEPAEPADTSAKQKETLLLSQLKDGNLKFTLQGQKLNGEFALVKMKGRDENAWLLIKKKDEFATTKNISKKDESVQSGKTLDQVARSTKSKQWGKTVTAKKAVKSSVTKKKSTSESKKKSTSGPRRKTNRRVE